MEEQNDAGKKPQKEQNLRKLKDSYEKIKEKYNFPDFRFMNENFEIENIQIEETELFVKMLRKHVTEKIFFVLRSLEMFINPQTAPVFIMNIIKQLSESEKETLKELYKKLARYEIEAFGLEAEYNEKKEAEFVKQVASDWKSIAEDLRFIYSAMKGNHEKEFKKSTKSYFG